MKNLDKTATKGKEKLSPCSKISHSTTKWKRRQLNTRVFHVRVNTMYKKHLQPPKKPLQIPTEEENAPQFVSQE